MPTKEEAEAWADRNGFILRNEMHDEFVFVSKPKELKTYSRCPRCDAETGDVDLFHVETGIPPHCDCGATVDFDEGERIAILSRLVSQLEERILELEASK
jgi:hypothetical protein